MASLGAFLDAELEYHDRCRDVLMNLRNKWPARYVGSDGLEGEEMLTVTTAPRKLASAPAQLLPPSRMSTPAMNPRPRFPATAPPLSPASVPTLPTALTAPPPPTASVSLAWTPRRNPASRARRPPAAMVSKTPAYPAVALSSSRRLCPAFARDSRIPTTAKMTTPPPPRPSTTTARISAMIITALHLRHAFLVLGSVAGIYRGLRVTPRWQIPTMSTAHEKPHRRRLPPGRSLLRRLRRKLTCKAELGKRGFVDSKGATMVKERNGKFVYESACRFVSLGYGMGELGWDNAFGCRSLFHVCLSTGMG